MENIDMDESKDSINEFENSFEYTTKHKSDLKEKKKKQDSKNWLMRTRSVSFSDFSLSLSPSWKKPVLWSKSLFT